MASGQLQAVEKKPTIHETLLLGIHHSKQSKPCTRLQCCMSIFTGREEGELIMGSSCPSHTL